ncbi:hypothetical protein VIMS_01416 [Mycobacterium marinum]|nr:hypothetical protein VIMS_01416 [Mycobacterium marinum]
MTALRPIGSPIGPECQVMPGDGLDTKVGRRRFRAAVSPG